MASAAMATAQVSRVVSAGPVVGQKSSFFAGSSSVSMLGCSNGSRVCMAEWLPGNPRPAYLDGSAPGDFGFDPLGLGEVPENLERFKESELIYARWAMLAVPGVLIPEALGYGNWVSAQKWAATPGGQATYLGNPVPWGTLPIILAVEFVAVAFAESQRNGEPDPEKRKYPGGPFDPLGFSKGANIEELKLKEIKNGRLALVAFLGFVIQAIAYPGTGPLENLKTHLADPWHQTIAQVLIPRSVI
jgi:light-harvesting complex I chlorophyll a/b binding protein 1